MNQFRIAEINVATEFRIESIRPNNTKSQTIRQVVDKSPLENCSIKG